MKKSSNDKTKRTSAKPAPQTSAKNAPKAKTVGAAKKPAKPKKPSKANDATAKPRRPAAPAEATPAPRTARNLVHRLRIELVSGPWADGENCVRGLDLPDGACLYDLHDAIQELVGFDNEHPFRFYRADPDGTDPEGVPSSIGPDADRRSIDCDVYEDINAFDALPPDGDRSLFYAYLSEGGDWTFEIRHTGVSGEPVPGASYPLPVESLAEGPDPSQYGHGFDDFAEDDDAFEPRRASRRDDDGDDGGWLFDEEEDDPFGDGGDVDRGDDGGDDGDW